MLRKLWVLSILAALMAVPTLAQEAMTPNETLVMNWIEQKFESSTIPKDVFAPDFVFYGNSDGPEWGAAEFIRLDSPKGSPPDSMALTECVVKGEHDLVQADYMIEMTYGLLPIRVNRTMLFRVENGMIAEAWLDHSL